MEAIKNSAIKIQNIGFKYPGQPVHCFSNLNLEVISGDKFGLFGPNGAGKTTLMNCMIGLLSIDEGSILIEGRKLKENRKEAIRSIGIVPQDFSFYQELTPLQNLEFFGAWAGLAKLELKMKSMELLSLLELENVKNRQIIKLSGGMKRRVNLAIGVLNNPSILFLDEPTVGVDIQTRHIIINYLKELNSKGTTLIYTSHQLSEAEELCDRVALIDKGKIIAVDRLEVLFKKYHEKNLEDLYLKFTGKYYDVV
ncbi:MAG: ABC transporter ATP-binding protein [Bacteroidota bacterium]